MNGFSTALMLALALLCSSFASEIAVVGQSAATSRIYNLDLLTVLGEPPEGTVQCGSGKELGPDGITENPFAELCFDVPMGAGQVARIERTALHQTSVTAAPDKKLLSGTLRRLDRHMQGKPTTPDDRFWARTVNGLIGGKQVVHGCQRQVQWLKDYQDVGEVTTAWFLRVAERPDLGSPACGAQVAAWVLDAGLEPQRVADGVRRWAEHEVEASGNASRTEQVIRQVEAYPDAVTGLFVSDIESWRSKARRQSWFSIIPRILQHSVAIGLSAAILFGIIAFLAFGAAEPTPVPVRCRTDGAVMQPAFDAVKTAMTAGSTAAGVLVGQVVGEVAGRVVGDRIGDGLGRLVEGEMGTSATGSDLAPLWKCPRCGSKRRLHQEWRMDPVAKAAQRIGCVSVVVVAGGLILLCAGLI